MNRGWFIRQDVVQDSGILAGFIVSVLERANKPVEFKDIVENIPFKQSATHAKLSELVANEILVKVVTVAKAFYTINYDVVQDDECEVTEQSTEEVVETDSLDEGTNEL